jgi:lysophospholipase L1-like esterase
MNILAGFQKVFKVFISKVLPVLLAFVIFALTEFSTRVYFRLSTGSWPMTRYVFFNSEMIKYKSLIRPHHYLNTVPRENAEEEIFGVNIVFNSLGYRSPERPLRKPEGVLRIVCSGGSTTFESFSPTNSSAWPSVLEEMLKNDGFRLEVWNAGAPAWSSQENIISLLIRDIDLEPDLLILYQSINDLRAATCQPFDRQYDRDNAPAVRGMMGFDLDPSPWYHRLVSVEKARDILLRKKEYVFDSWTIRKTGERLQVLHEEGVEVFERNVRSYVRLGRGIGSRVILVTQPMIIREGHTGEDVRLLELLFPDLDPAYAIRELKKLNDVVRRVAVEEDVMLIDAAEKMVFEEGDLIDPMHFKAQGSLKFATLIKPAVAEELSMVERPR